MANAADRYVLEDAIESYVDAEYHRGKVRTYHAGILHSVIIEHYGLDVSRKEVEDACEGLVDEDRLVFLYDSFELGRRYCSSKIPGGAVERLRHRQEVETNGRR